MTCSCVPRSTVCGFQSCTVQVKVFFFCHHSGAAYLSFLVQWFPQSEEAEQARSLLLSHRRRHVGNKKCITGDLLYSLCLNGKISLEKHQYSRIFVRHLKQSSKIVAAFCGSLTRWGVGSESVLKPVMLFRLGTLKHNMSRKPTKMHVFALVSIWLAVS